MLETYWERNNLKAPVYFSAGMSERVWRFINSIDGFGLGEVYTHIDIGLAVDMKYHVVWWCVVPSVIVLSIGRGILQALYFLDKRKDQEVFCASQYVRLQPHQDL